MTLNLFGKWKWNNWFDKKETSGSGSHSPIASDHISAVANSCQSEVFGGRSKKQHFTNWRMLLKTYILLKSGWSDRLRNRFWSKNINCRPDIPGMPYLANNKKAWHTCPCRDPQHCPWMPTPPHQWVAGRRQGRRRGGGGAWWRLSSQAPTIGVLSICRRLTGSAYLEAALG